MLYKISHDHGFHYWDEKNEPVLRIQPGDSVEFETKDCLCNVLTEQKSATTWPCSTRSTSTR